MQKVTDRGMSVLELALILPLLMLLLAIMLDLGMSLRRYLVIVEAAKRGVRVAASLSSADPAPLCSALDSAVQTAANNYLDDNSITSSNYKVQSTFCRQLAEPPLNSIPIAVVRLEEQTRTCYVCIADYVLPLLTFQTSHALNRECRIPGSAMPAC